MSFSHGIKRSIIAEIAKYERRIPHLLMGILQSAARIVEYEQGMGEDFSVLLVSENAALVKLVLRYIRESNRDLQLQVSLEHKKSGRARARYSLCIENAMIFLKLHHIEVLNGEMSLEIPDTVFHKDIRQKDYIAGFFLGAGLIANPEKSYHLEFACRCKEQANGLIRLLENIGIQAKSVSRGYSEIVYIKDSATIADMLSVMGATTERFSFENAKIVKELRNNVNRLVNCDTANLNRVADVAHRQLEAIRLIDKTLGLSSLDDKLRAAAELRLESPELSLKDLGQMLNPPIGKSGMNHRFCKIEEIARKIDETGDF